MDWLRDHAWETWLGLTILLGVAELFSMDLILLMLAAGAGVGVIAALLGAPLVLQVLLFAIASVAALALVRPSALKRLHSGPELSLGHGKLVGHQASYSPASPSRSPVASSSPARSGPPDRTTRPS